MSTDGMNPLVEFTNLIQFHKLFLLIVLLGCLIAIVKLLQKFGEKLQNKFHQRRILILQLVTIISFFLYLVGGGTLFYVIINPPKELLLALGGSAAVAIGFSLKDLVGSFVAGIVLLFDRPFQVGDRVTFNDVYGEIISIGLRAVRLRTLDDSIVTVPNAKFISEVVSSGNAGDLDMMIVVDFHVALDADINKARDLLYELVVTSKYVFLKKPVKIVVSEVEIAHRLAIQLKVKAYVLDVQYEKAFQTDIVSRAVQVFNKFGIKRPGI